MSRTAAFREVGKLAWQGMDLRGGGPSARNHRLRGQPHERGEQMASVSLPKERASGGLQVFGL